MDKPVHYSLSVAQKHLRRVDKTMASLMRKVGPTSVRCESERSVYQSLLRAIVYQMLSTQSAAAIHGRLVEACPGGISPESVLALGESRLRDIGFSRAKVIAVMDLTEKTRNGSIPPDADLVQASDEELVKCLTAVKGIGVWSVEMMMIFNLQRADVLPATDLGVRKGHMMAYGLDDMLPAKALLLEGELWRPYRSVAAWYLWRATDSVVW